MLYAFPPAGHEGPPNLLPVHFPRVPFLSIFLNASWIQFGIISLLYISFLDTYTEANLSLLHEYQRLERYASHPPDEIYPNMVKRGKLYLSFSSIHLLLGIRKPLV